LGGDLERLLDAGQNAFGARQNRDAVFLHRGAGLLFEAHHAREFRRRPDEGDFEARQTSAKSAFSLRKP
jgi:hypothetical protein